MRQPDRDACIEFLALYCLHFFVLPLCSLQHNKHALNCTAMQACGVLHLLHPIQYNSPITAHVPYLVGFTVVEFL